MKISNAPYLLSIFVLMLIASASFGQTSVTSGVTNVGYALNTSAIAIDPGLAIASGSNITGFKVTISSGLKPSDVLSFTGTLPSGITVTSYNSGTGVLTFHGTTTAANWENLLRTVTYANSNIAEYGQRTISFSAGNLSANANGHFYELVNTNVDWNTAKSNAEAQTYLGLTGYLATITSTAEIAFIRQILNADAWMGASDEFSEINTATGMTTYIDQTASEGNWYWVTGPEKGTMFSTGNINPVTQSGQFANWDLSEPSNTNGEHFGEVYAGSSPGAWNDLSSVASMPYIVEYGGLVSDPIQNISASTVINIEISANTTSAAQVVCENSTAATITGATPYGGEGTYTYKWISSTTNASSGYADAIGTINTSNYSPGVIAADTWYRRVVTSGSLVDTSSAVAITLHPSIISSVNIQDPLCFGSEGSATVLSSGGTGSLTYSWSSGGNAATETNLLAGTYTVTITDAIGCTHEEQVSIISPTQIQFSITQNSPLCNGGTGNVSVSATGGLGSYTYQWSNGVTTASQTGIPAGNYDITITDMNGCKRTTTVHLTQPSLITASSTTTNVLTVNDGTIDLTVVGGTPGYTFAWDNGATTEDLSGLVAGDYTVMVTDANGCTFSTTITVSSSVGLFEPIVGRHVISVYPNPTNGNITLKGVQAGQYRVVDAVGRMMTSFTVQQQDVVNLDLSELSNGLYYIQSMNSSNSLAKFNIIK
jgi:hypothetical protein